MATLNYECRHHKDDTTSKHLCCFCSSVKTNILLQSLVACKDPGSVSESKHIASFACPDDLILSMLLLLPANVLYEVMRTVCRGWRHIIKSPYFITNHHRISSSASNSLLIVEHSLPRGLYIEPQTNPGDSDFRVTELSLPLFRSRIVGSCRGLVLLHDLRNRKQYHVVNPVTKAIVSLPPFPSTPPDCHGLYVSFSYASCSDRYKVVHRSPDFPLYMDNPPFFLVCTVGIDQSWREIDLQGMTIDKEDREVFFGRSFSIQGIIYWTLPQNLYGFAIDVDMEIMHRFPSFVGLPPPRRGKHIGHCIKLHTGLGFSSTRRDHEDGDITSWEVYELTDYKSSKWTKITSIDVRTLKSKLEKYLYPGAKPYLNLLLYMRNGDVWFTTGIGMASKWSCLYCYRLSTGNIVQLPVYKDHATAYHHFNILFTPKSN